MCCPESAALPLAFACNRRRLPSFGWLSPQPAALGRPSERAGTGTHAGATQVAPPCTNWRGSRAASLKAAGDVAAVSATQANSLADLGLDCQRKAAGQDGASCGCRHGGWRAGPPPSAPLLACRLLSQNVITSVVRRLSAPPSSAPAHRTPPPGKREGGENTCPHKTCR